MSTVCPEIRKISVARKLYTYSRRLANTTARSEIYCTDPLVIGGIFIIVLQRIRNIKLINPRST
jgi:hypothetical protein